MIPVLNKNTYYNFKFDIKQKENLQHKKKNSRVRNDDFRAARGSSVLGVVACIGNVGDKQW